MAGTLTRKSSRTKVDPAANGEADAKTASAKTDTTKKDTAKKDTAKKDAVKKDTTKKDTVKKDTVKKATAKTTAAPAPKKATKAKAPTTTAKTAAPKTRTKRPMTPEIEDSAEGDDSDKQPTKRARSIRTQGSVTTTASSDDEVKQVSVALKKAAIDAKKAISEKKEKRKSAATNASSSKKTINSLPTPPEHPRPSNQIFVWGAGNFGQFGMGPEYLDEFDKPKKNPWFEKKIEEGIFGGEGAGIESIAAGGLHSLFVDEKGTVSYFTPCFYLLRLILIIL